MMHEEIIRAFVRGDEPLTLLIAEPLYDSCRQAFLLPDASDAPSHVAGTDIATWAGDILARIIDATVYGPIAKAHDSVRHTKHRGPGSAIFWCARSPRVTRGRGRTMSGAPDPERRPRTGADRATDP